MYIHNSNIVTGQPSQISPLCVCMVLSISDLEELCGVEAMAVGQSCGGQAADLLRRALQAEERALRSEEALARAMEDLHKLKSVLISLNLMLKGAGVIHAHVDLSLILCMCFCVNILYVV